MRLAELAKEMRQIVFGNDGFPEWGTKFREIESKGMHVGLELARLFMEQSVDQQAAHVPDAALECHGEQAERGSETKTTPLETTAGEILWDQPQTRLPNSGRAFFPSSPGVGNQPG